MVVGALAVLPVRALLVAALLAPAPVVLPVRALLVLLLADVAQLPLLA